MRAGRQRGNQPREGGKNEIRDPLAGPRGSLFEQESATHWERREGGAPLGSVDVRIAAAATVSS